MKIFNIVLIGFVVASSALISTSKADPVGSVLDLNSRTIEEFQNLNFLQTAQESFNHMVEQAAVTLEVEGYPEDATQMRAEWDVQFSLFLSGISAQDVGDYSPLSPWFAGWYKKMEMRFGESKLASLHLNDFKTLNFTIPVVFLPKGNKKTKQVWSENEYTLHFVPFSGILTYWGSLGACIYITKRTGAEGVRQYCKDIAGIVRTGMENYAAPRLSSFIYNKANRDRFMIAIPMDDYNNYLQSNLIEYQ